MREIDLNKEPEVAHEASSSDQLPAPGDQHGERSQGHAGDFPISDFLRYFAQNPSSHQEQGEHSRQREAESHPALRSSLEAQRTLGSAQSAFLPWKSQQSQEAHWSTDLHSDGQEQRWLDGASSSQQPHQISHPSLTLMNRRTHFDDLQWSVLPHGPSLSAPESGYLVQEHQDVILLHQDEPPISSASDTSNLPDQNCPSFSQERGRKRKHHEASSSGTQAALEQNPSQKERRSLASRKYHTKPLEAIRKRKLGEELTDHEKRILDTYDRKSAKINKNRSEARRKRKLGEELTDHEKRILDIHDRNSAKINKNRSEARRKRKLGEELTDYEKRILDTYDRNSAKASKNRSEARRKRKLGEELTDYEKRILDAYDRHNAKASKNRSEARKKENSEKS